MSSEITAVDLFCGAGGFSNGFENAGINIKFGVDNNKKALKTFKNNHDANTINQDIREGVPKELLNLSLDIVIGSPPCKGFSDARGSRYVDDNRNGLVFEYIHWVSKLDPDIAVMENVTGMRTISDDFISGLKNEFSEIGYPNVDIYNLNSANFGVPQARKRVIIVASKKNVHPSDIKESVSSENIRTTVEDAFCDLPSVTDSKESIEIDYNNCNMKSEYSKYVRDLDESKILHNHICKNVSKDDIWKKVIERLDPGEMYRSTRFGDRYRQVWDILEDEFSDIQTDILQFIGNHRSKKEYRIKGKTVGHVNISKIKNDLDYKSDDIETAICDLQDKGWIRKDESDGLVGYDLNTKSGVRPRYMRLQPNSQSNTIMTTDFKPREKLHPYKNRGLSLREGARIQSFPDSFVFKGSFQDISSQIGNAVPPMMSYKIADIISDVI